MKVTLNWLKQYIDVPWTAEELAERLTMLGLEVEGVQKLGGEFEGVVVAQVITRDKHPNADKLSLCRVNDGAGERQIVCGAQNFKAGDKVPLILPGASLPAKPGEAPFTIKVGKIRGVESHGMMCSPQELGLGDSVDGLLILKEDAKVGQSFAEYLGRSGGDVIYDLEITPNRPDLNSVIGIAREISALSGKPLRRPEIKHAAVSSDVTAASLVSVRIDDPELCPRYTARVVRGVKVAPSPDWLKGMLEKVGIRSINNVVDVTNYVMLETGQPLHAFDYHLLNPAPGQGRPVIVVKRAGEGEKFVTLDGQSRLLNREVLLIADETKAVALAGVMGGQNSEINSKTADVLIESACFKPQNIRATSKKLGLRTESAYRFERGADVGICDWASARAAQLILETAGGELASGVVDAYPNPVELRQVPLRHGRTNAVLGIDVPVEQQVQLLQRLELEPAAADGRSPDTTVFRVPTFRVDLKREIDLVEEVTRLYGIDKVPATPPRGAVGANAFDAVHDTLAEARHILVALGLFEAQGQTLISSAAARLAQSEGLVAMANPLSSDMDVLRPSLLPGLLDSLRHNLRHRNEEVALFEIGRVFSSPAAQAGKPAGAREERRLAIALTGRRPAAFWSGAEREAKFDIYDLKGILEEFFEQFGLRGMTYQRQPASTSLFIESGIVQLGKFELGRLGQLLPVLGRQYDLRDPVMLAELNLDQLLARRNTDRTFKTLPAFPAIRRDVAMLVPVTTSHDSIAQQVKQARPANLESVELFDVFRGKNVPAGEKSVAYAFTYRNPERTLTDVEVNAAHEKLVAQLKLLPGTTIREG
ncbi:MAG TPA: phenylalanine--tRNA ligase subunit beta, partial [Methylomirabilota bacterium]|nr:phenylalanine--tRNA ligase subunit beta [Methylomirabilota bacterium]